MEGANWRVILDGLRDGDQESWVEFDGHFRRQMLSAMARKFPKLQSSESARDVVSTALQQIVHQIRSGSHIEPARLPGYVLTTCISEVHQGVSLPREHSEPRNLLARLRTRIFRPFNGRSHHQLKDQMAPVCAESDETIASIRNGSY
jgi:hypothetical protein